MHRERTCLGLWWKSAILAAGLLLGGCAAMQEESRTTAALALPPITAQPTGEVHPGKFVWHDLLTPDVVASQTFYGELFGWSFRKVGDYIVIHNGDRMIGGILAIQPKDEKEVAAQWLSVMSVTDVDEAAEHVDAEGGRIINGSMDLGERGRAALIADPEGAHLLLLRARDGDPADREPAMGDWLWNEVWTLDPDPVVVFYNTLGQYEEILQEADYAIFINGGHWRAGVRRIESEAFAGRWVPVVRVKDPLPLLEKVESLGGEVLVRPGEDESTPGVALISDTTGALLMLQAWNFANEGERN